MAMGQAKRIQTDPAKGYKPKFILKQSTQNNFGQL